MRLTVSFHDKKDKDILDYIGKSNRPYKIKEAIRKAIQFDKWMETVLAKGLGAEVPRNREEVIKSGLGPIDDTPIPTSDKIPELTPEEIEKRLNQF